MGLTGDAGQVLTCDCAQAGRLVARPAARAATGLRRVSPWALPDLSTAEYDGLRADIIAAEKHRT